MKNTDTPSIERLKELLAKATTRFDQSKMHGRDYDCEMLATFREIVRLLPSIIATLETLTPSAGEGVERPRPLGEVTGIGASYDREADEWSLYTMPDTKPFGVTVKGYDRQRIDWIMATFRAALASPPSFDKWDYARAVLKDSEGCER